MDLNARYRQKAPARPAHGHGPSPQLFEDISQAYPPNFYAADPQQTYASQQGYAAHSSFNPALPQQFAPQQWMADPMANMAMQYGSNLAEHGQQMVKQNLEKYVSTSRLKYYFAVDTSYVGKKLGLLLFPFLHSDWSIRYSQDEPVAPRFEVNAPDLYIPVMSFVTYILLAGIALGTQDRFSPEQLGITASSALVWLIMEIVLLLLAMYILQLSTDIRYLDLLAYCGYKYLGIVACLVASIIFSSTGYYPVLAWMGFTLAFFLVRSLRLAIVPHSEALGEGGRGSHRRLYLLLSIALSQPVLMWWLTRHLVS